MILMWIIGAIAVIVGGYFAVQYVWLYIKRKRLIRQAAERRRELEKTPKGRETLRREKADADKWRIRQYDIENKIGKETTVGFMHGCPVCGCRVFIHENKSYGKCKLCGHRRIIIEDDD